MKLITADWFVLEPGDYCRWNPQWVQAHYRVDDPWSAFPVNDRYQVMGTSRERDIQGNWMVRYQMRNIEFAGGILPMTGVHAEAWDAEHKLIRPLLPLWLPTSLRPLGEG